MASRTIGRAAAACTVTAALAVGGALPAAQAHPQYDEYGWVKVCQKVDKPDYKQDYSGKYSVKDEKSYYDFYLDIKYPCHQVKVHKGWVKVKIVYAPKYAKLHGRDYYDIYVDKGQYK